jgi:hypothetical protein
VLPAHQGYYLCVTYGGFRGCSLLATGVQVYGSAANPQLDPGYSMTAPYRLEVTPSAYGTGISP